MESIPPLNLAEQDDLSAFARSTMKTTVNHDASRNMNNKTVEINFSPLPNINKSHFHTRNNSLPVSQMTNFKKTSESILQMPIP